MINIRPEDLSFENFDGFRNFLQDNLNWPIREVSKESLTYEFLPEELKIDGKQLNRLAGDTIYQLIPFIRNQPWGIFLLELNDPKVYVTFLRQILRRLVPSRRKSSILPTWKVENLLFICTYDYKDFTFAHFKGEKYQKAKLSTFNWTFGETRLRTLCEFNLPSLFYDEEFQDNHQKWLTEWSKAFDKERLTEEFFDAYKFALKFIKGILSAQNKSSLQEVHSFAQQLLSRIMFLYFVEKKGWLKWKDYVQDKKYIWNLWLKYKKYETREDTFHSLWLSSLFFQAFNKKHGYLNFDLPDEIKESFDLMPYLNGELFTENELDKIGFSVPDRIFGLLFEIDPYDKRNGLLERYNFTIREDTPLDIEVAVDPEMLGKVYESLISEEERGKAGIFYTPRTEIDYMCRLSLVEYLFEETEISKEELISLIFEPEKILECENETNLKQIRRTLDKVRVVDPAVGSASFLVGMMNVLVDIHRNLSSKIDGREENLFALKNKVISENLYGVDVKDWAVMVGELRLWLSLVIDTDEKELLKMGQNIYQQPLLPNLTFKIHQGDSLVEEIAGIPLSLRGKFKYIPKSTKQKLTEIIDKKREYFRSARLDRKKEIENLENKLFKDIVGNEIKRIEGEIKKLEAEIYEEPEQLTFIKPTVEQQSLFKEEMQKLRAKIRGLSGEREKLMEALEDFGKKETKDYFLWEIDFAEIFAEKDGFDIVIGNPPYVRQEKIAFPLEKEENYENPEEWRARKRLYKEKLASSVKMHWGNAIKINKKSDLYVYFYYHGLALLRPSGIFCFINSNSWLDVGYGACLQEFLLKNMEPLYIVDNQARRSFKESDVNTIIVAVKRPERMKDTMVRFVNYKKSFEEVLTTDNLVKIERSSKVTSTDDFRVFPIAKKELLQDGVELPKEKTLLRRPEDLPYIGSKWGGKYLRAPDIFFKILEKGKGKLVRLGDIAEVRRGFTTGANEFFYLEPTGQPAPKGLVHVRNSAGWEGFLEREFLKPVLCTQKEVDSLIVEPRDLRYVVFICRKPKRELRGIYALDYIEWGRKQGYHKRPSCRGRKYWWNLAFQERQDFIMLRFRDQRNWTPVIIHDIAIGDVVFVGKYKEGSSKSVFDAILNSTLQVFITEVFGRINLGDGLLTTYGPEILKFILPVPDCLTDDQRSHLDIAFKGMSRRSVKSIFQELGLPKPKRDYSNIDPNDVSLDKVMPDRRELDRIIFEALGLTEEEQLEVYRAVVELLKNRLVKARSV